MSYGEFASKMANLHSMFQTTIAAAAQRERERIAAQQAQLDIIADELGSIIQDQVNENGIPGRNPEDT